MRDLFSQKLFAKGCTYLVATPGDICNKCGQQHNLTAMEAKVWPYDNTTDGDGDND